MAEMVTNGEACTRRADIALARLQIDFSDDSQTTAAARALCQQTCNTELEKT